MTARYDLRFVEACIPLLEDYLLSKELDWPPGITAETSSPPYPRLTIGNLLLFLQRLHGRQVGGVLDETLEQRLGQADQQLKSVQDQWLSHWARKAQRELGYRLRMWGNFLEDYRENASANADRFAYEVRLRAMIERLIPECAQVSTAERSMLAGLDQILRGVITPGKFIWEDEIQAGFPADQYWFLYGHLKR